jgi:hypothetical protein
MFIAEDIEPKAGEAKKSPKQEAIPQEEGKLPWGYFLYGGRLRLYHADLSDYGDEYTDAGMIYWPKKYESVTHIYLENGAVVLAIY